jgi:multisubunit Na+/H+ antiporter MnhE subunit
MLEFISANPIIGALVAAVGVYLIFKILGIFATLIKVGFAIAIFCGIMYWLR